ncbi:transporter substrate-binding domain-containing protein [Spartinivicinus poritis]|uniref:Transporter substrate-binding domain-containing protein n=1 Tax=Spartinivicinus poritis TaxID=2994640 RepID=A0ABT5U6P6_9GAMM|nr:transporter substrate-binding domain-containing protein [Spartinivicinus sp. A2-2]MDE1462048.1 transporter substrate-binding domain-containing protein [Spartinivicinus sp. A2-2]
MLIQVSSFADIAALGNKGVILTVFGTATSRFLKKRPEKLIIDEAGYTPIDNLKKLVNKRGRFFYYYDYGMLYSIKMGGFKNKVTVLPMSFRKYQHYIIYSKSVAENTIKEVNQIISRMKQSGEMDSVRKKYQ